MQRLRLPNQNKPINVNLKRLSNNSVIQSFVGVNADEINFPTISEGFYVESINSIGQTNTTVIDNVTRILQSKNHIGRSVANGNTQNHLEALSQSISRGFTYLGCIFPGWENDAQLIAFESSTFDHTVSHSSYDHPFDEVVRTAYLTSPGNTEAALMNRVSLKPKFDLCIQNNRLNNGSDRTLFFGIDDCNKRVDGSLSVRLPSGPVPASMIPSYGANNVATFADRGCTALFKRYRTAWNDGTLMSLGLATSDAAESEFLSYLKNENNDNDGESRGDFHDGIIAKFKAFFPIYNGTSKLTIAANDLNGSDLAKRWWASLARIMADFEKARIATIKANVPGLTRTKFWEKDCGSFADSQAARRRTYNCFYDLPDEIMVVKSNDDCNVGEARIRFYMEDLDSRGRLKGAIKICEPTPTGGDFSPSGSRAQVLQMMGIMKEYGIGMSFISANLGIIDDLRSASNFQQYSNPLYKNEFLTISGNKKLQRVTVNLSDLLSGIGMDNKKNAYESLKTSSGLDRVDIVTYDDIMP